MPDFVILSLCQYQSSLVLEMILLEAKISLALWDNMVSIRLRS